MNRTENWIIFLLIVALAGVTCETIYLGDVVRQQQHTIRQLNGLEIGPDATPYIREYVPSPDLRKI